MKIETFVKKFRADKDPGIFRISVLHCNCGGQVGHDPYVPCTVRQLEETGFDYWALAMFTSGWNFPPIRT